MYIRGKKREGLASDADLSGLRIGLVSLVHPLLSSFQFYIAIGSNTALHLTMLTNLCGFQV